MSTQTATRIPAINQLWPEQGGIFIGSRLIEGVVHHVVIPGGVEFDHPDTSGDRVELVVAEGDELNGFSDWRAGDQEDLMLAFINSRERFEKEYYWSRSSYHGWTWAVDFEFGLTGNLNRAIEFRVRPFRSFPDSSL